MSGKEYPVPQELVDIHDDSMAAKHCRDQCVKSSFRYKRATYYGRQYIQANRDFWEKIRDIYPELAIEPLEYSPNRKTVFVTLKGNP